MVTSCALSAHCGSPIDSESDYRSIAGALVCQFLHKPLDQHLKAVKRILRYLQGTTDYGIGFTVASRMSLVGYSDANWGIDLDDRRSTTRFCVFLGGNLVSWGSKKQQVIFRSMTEAKYWGLTYATAKTVWLESVLAELKVPLTNTGTVWCDNSGAVALSDNPVLHSSSSMSS
ncbi:secreted RxLR effector protein 161-like [Gossypium raimondii]|uniref:secreted RxLR effector protein 161-like n=1 Tax=Gossypium raimondii TaxID=29730 RepID=UPI00227B9978|nr:secreted RxLR effector protein 161-like [Gossypium raimondii]